MRPPIPAGTITALWRYPVKSMQGEALDAVRLEQRGLTGDRGYAVREQATGHIASAKHPRKWAMLLDCQATYLEEPRAGTALPPVLIKTPQGQLLRSDQPDIDQLLSQLLGREVTLITQAPSAPTREANRSPAEQRGDAEIIRQEALALAAPVGTFFDYAPVHVLTTATLASLTQIYPQGCFDPRRFRPNLLIQVADDTQGFVEQSWLGQRLSSGATGQLALIDPCPRCVVPTLAQAELPHDPQILRVLSAHTRGTSITLAPGASFSAVAGVYGHVVSNGMLHVGATVILTPGGN